MFVQFLSDIHCWLAGWLAALAGWLAGCCLFAVSSLL
jgi:hypothetical protein